MEAVSDPDVKIDFNYEQERSIFTKTFKILASTLGEKAFGYANTTRTKITRAFGILQFEALSLGMQPVLSKINPDDREHLEKFTKLITEMKLTADYITLTTGGGKNSRSQLKNRVDYVENGLNKIF
jgi:hypothetical protein